MDESHFMKWYWQDATEEEKKLFNRIGDFEEFFQDMLFAPGTSSYYLIQCQSKPTDSDEWIEDESPRPEELEYFSYTFFHFKVEPLSDCGGYYSHSEQLLCVPPEALNDDELYSMS